MRLSTLITATILLASTQSGFAQTAPLRVLASNGMKAVIDQLKPQLEQEVKRPLAIQFDTSAAIKQHIEAGDAFDVTVLTTEIVTELVKSGKIASGSVGSLG